MHDYILSLKTKNPDLKSAEITGLLYIIYSKDNLSNNELIRLTGLPKTVLKEFKASIAELLKDSKLDTLSLNEKGLEIVSQLDARPYNWTLLEHDLNDEEDFIFSIRVKYNLEPKREFDQFFATSKSTVEKARMLMDKDLVDGKNIALIGDDDLVSIALGRMSPNYKSIKVYDVDQSILDTIEKIAKDYHLDNITTKLHDVRQPFSASERAKYDAVLIDPPYTKSGAKLFIHRAIELLSKDKTYAGKYVFLNYGAGLRNPMETTKIQEIINNYNLVIEDCINKYTRYHGAETVGSASSMYVLKATPFTDVTNKILHTKIYTFEDIETEKFPYVDHFVFKLQKISKSTLISKNSMMKILGEFCRIHRLKVKDTTVSKFKNQGFSFTYILANSNLVVHTWPEKNALHMDLITCVPLHDKEIVVETLSNLFKTEFIEITHVE